MKRWSLAVVLLLAVLGAAVAFRAVPKRTASLPIPKSLVPVVLPALADNVEGVRRASYDFLWHLHYQDWQSAWSLLSSRGKNAQFRQSIKQTWLALEQTHGRKDTRLGKMMIDKWTQGKSPITIHIVPIPYSDINYQVNGAKRATVSMHMVKENGNWRVDGFKIGP